MPEIEEIEIRCPNCGKLAMKALSVHGGEVKCVRCKKLYKVSVQAPIRDASDPVPFTDTPSNVEVLKE
jgi:phage FluMu protein Com